MQKRIGIRGLVTAVLFPSVDLLGDSITVRPGEVDPLASVVGISLFQRAVLTLQRGGIRQLIVLTGPEEEHLKQALSSGPRVSIPVRWMPIREFPLDDPRTWEFLGAEVGDCVLLLSANAIFSPHLIEHLRRESRHGKAIVVARPLSRSSTMGNRGSVKSGVRLQVCGKRLTAWAPPPGDHTAPLAAAMVVLPAALLTSASRDGGMELGRLPIRRWLELVGGDGNVRVVEATDKQGLWYQEVTVPSDLPLAERKLFHSLRADAEGFVDRYFNRKLSRWFTRLFLRAGWSPNVITVVASLIGFTAAVGFSIGTYAAGVVAALLFQLAAVIDCCDGEVARLTFAESPFGAWLDLFLDNLVHMAIFTGIAIGLYTVRMGEPGAWGWLALGGVTVLGNGLSFLLVEQARKIKAANRWKTAAGAAWADFMLKNVASRDFSLMLLLFAILAKLDWFLSCAAVGSLLFAAVMAWVIRPSAVTPPNGPV
ncbi:MAG: CDP-alcohol phosphatidyltransferase family protein [Nitrospira sp.]|nr:CDP-alcohol phosphatidyltransferase family protein [Nitrospira sp.]